MGVGTLSVPDFLLWGLLFYIMEGAILISRALIDSEVFASEKLLKIWIWLLIKANFKERNVPIKIGAGQSVVTIKRGQLLFGRLSAENELFIDGSTIYKCIKKLEAIGNITIESNSHYSVITICNYDHYQDFNTYAVTAIKQPRNKQVTAEEQPSNTPNKENKENKVYIYSEFYDLEIEKSKDNPNIVNYEKYVRKVFGLFGVYGKMDKVLKIKKQLTFEQFQQLFKKSGANNINLLDLLESFDNYDSKTYKPTTVYSSLNGWINNEIGRKKK